MEVARIRAVKSDAERLNRDLRELCRLAVEQGAQDAKVYSCRKLSWRRPDRKALLLPAEKQSLHWPVALYPKDSIKQALARYRWAVAFRVPVGSGSLRAAYERLYWLAARIESACFYKGYHLALGLASGNCREVFCGQQRRCWAMVKGRACLHPNKARPSIEACGLDPGEIGANLGWLESPAKVAGGRGKGKKAPDRGQADSGSPAFLMGMVFVD